MLKILHGMIIVRLNITVSWYYLTIAQPYKQYKTELWKIDTIYIYTSEIISISNL